MSAFLDRQAGGVADPAARDIDRRSRATDNQACVWIMPGFEQNPRCGSAPVQSRAAINHGFAGTVVRNREQLHIHSHTTVRYSLMAKI